MVRSGILVREKKKIQQQTKHTLTADTVRASLMCTTRPGEKMFTLIQSVKVRTSGPAAASRRTVSRERKGKEKKKGGKKEAGLEKKASMGHAGRVRGAEGGEVEEKKNLLQD